MYLQIGMRFDVDLRSDASNAFTSSIFARVHIYKRDKMFEARRAYKIGMTEEACWTRVVQCVSKVLGRAIGAIDAHDHVGHIDPELLKEFRSQLKTLSSGSEKERARRRTQPLRERRDERLPQRLPSLSRRRTDAGPCPSRRRFDPWSRPCPSRYSSSLWSGSAPAGFAASPQTMRFESAAGLPYGGRRPTSPPARRLRRYPRMVGR
jgi:hypothetical protein